MLHSPSTSPGRSRLRLAVDSKRAAANDAAYVDCKLSIVIPVRDEAENVAPLVHEIEAVLRERAPFEIIFVDDASTDDTVERVLEARAQFTNVRLLRLANGCGQSIAIRIGARAARAPWIVTLDGDGQNDPADIPKMLDALNQADRNMRLIMGNRLQRRDTFVRRLSSRVANGIRQRMLHDRTHDTGCGIKLFHRETFLDLPSFDHMHRFLPALFLRAGAEVVSVPVHHRPRTHGRSKYGVWNRLWVGIVDLFGVRWLIRRAPRLTEIIEE
jgi:dolichol-phosphate mannosyltransferase